MNYKNIASIVNTAVSNSLGVAVTVTEDLANIVEVAKAISGVTASTLKDFKNELLVGVHNEIINRIVDTKDYKIYKSAQEYGGALQRLANANFLTAQDSHLLNLQNGVSYLDGKFYGGPSLSVAIVEDTKAFKVVHSISDDDFSQKFTNAGEVAQFIGMIETNEENTIRTELAVLERKVLNKAIVEAYGAGRKVDLLTEFNAKLGRGDSTNPDYTLADIYADRKLMAYFSDFCKATIEKVNNYMLEPNKRYNDGTITTFARRNDIFNVFITDFITDTKFLGDSIDYKAPMFVSSLETINAWQNPGEDMLIALDDATSIKYGDAEDPTTIENVIGVVYDIASMGITTVRNKMTVEPVGAEGFENLHHHIANKYYVDKRFGTVVFTLD